MKITVPKLIALIRENPKVIFPDATLNLAPLSLAIPAFRFQAKTPAGETQSGLMWNGPMVLPLSEAYLFALLLLKKQNVPLFPPPRQHARMIGHPLIGRLRGQSNFSATGKIAKPLVDKPLACFLEMIPIAPYQGLCCFE